MSSSKFVRKNGISNIGTGLIMAIISDEYRFIYFCTPGTGSTATAHALVNQLGARWSLDDYEKCKHYTLEDLLINKIISTDQGRLYRKFSTVRNPYDFLISEYLRYQRWAYLLGKGNSWVSRNPKKKKQIEFAVNGDFGDFLKLYLDVFPENHLFLAEYWQPCDYIMNFESLQEDFEAVLKLLGIEEKIEIPRMNVTERDRDAREFSNYYSNELGELVYRKYRPFLKKFGYSLNGLSTDFHAAQNR